MKKHYLLGNLMFIISINMAYASSLPITLSTDQISTTNSLHNSTYAVNTHTLLDNKWFEEMSYTLISTENTSSDLLSHSFWWPNPDSQITIDLQQPFNVQDILIQVDSNDLYQLEYSIDDINWKNLLTISPNQEPDTLLYGMNTLSTNPLHNQYSENIDFTPVSAQYLRLSASGGDYAYFISELQIFGNPINTPVYTEASFTPPQNVSSVSTPSTLLLFSMGLLILTGLNLWRKQTT